MLKKRNRYDPLPPRCLGTGLIAMDMVTNGDQGGAPHVWAGGSCGNVLIILAYFGWRTFPVARLGNDRAAKVIAEDMCIHGVDLRHVKYDKSVHTPIILQRILTILDGHPTHRFYWVCPSCGNWLPRYRPALLKDAKALAGDDAKVTCFYFDRVSAAAIHLADKAREQGAIVVFEPTTIREDDQFAKAVAACHVLKYSNDRSKDFATIACESPAQVVIETLGAEGLRFRLREKGKCGKWKLLPAFPVANLKDAAGAGDWCTAGIIDILAEDRRRRQRISEKRIVEALRYGQALGAINCAYEGARGAMYYIEKRRFRDEVQVVLDRKEATIPAVDSLSPKAKRTAQCVCPACQTIPGRRNDLSPH